MTLYKKYANEITDMIESGTLKAGERMPSVREASRHRGLSVSTVLKTYHWLESRGIITARTRSGFYVSQRRQSWPPQPSVSSTALQSAPVKKADLIYEVLDAVREANVVPLGSAFPSPHLFPLARLYRSLNRSMRNLDPRATVTDLAPGNLELRRQIALRYHLDDIEIAAEELVITDGAMEALNLCLQAVTQPGDAVVIESPTFYTSLQALEQRGLRAIEVATHPAQGIDLDALETVLKTQQPAACWVMTNFQNPLGALMPQARKQQLVKLLAQYKVPLIEDDVYGELYYASKRPKPAKAFDHNANVLHCGSFSKCLAPGYRIGWAAPGRYAEKVRKLKLGTSLSAAIPSQLALADYLGEASYDRHLRQLRESLSIERDAMISAIHTHLPKATSVTRPEGGYFLWVELPPGTDALQLHQRALAENISIAPGAIFSASDQFKNCIRINYGHPEDRRIIPALKTLAKLIASD